MRRDIEETVRTILFSKQIVTAHSLRQELARASRKVSLVSIYKALGNLVRKGVAIKSGATYIVNISWLLKSRQTLDKLYNSLLHGQFVDEILRLDFLENHHEKFRWRFTSLAEANTFWIQVLISLAGKKGVSEIYEFVPHLWFAYLPGHQDETIQSALKQCRTKIVVYTSGDTALDREISVPARAARSYRVLHLRPFKSWPNTRYSCVAGNWVVQVTVPVALAEELDKVYQQTKVDSPAVRHQIVTLLQGKYPCSLMIQYEPVVAKRLLMRIQQ